MKKEKLFIFFGIVEFWQAISVKVKYYCSRIGGAFMYVLLVYL